MRLHADAMVNRVLLIVTDVRNKGLPISHMVTLNVNRHAMVKIGGRVMALGMANQAPPAASFELTQFAKHRIGASTADDPAACTQQSLNNLLQISERFDKPVDHLLNRPNRPQTLFDHFPDLGSLAA